MSLGGTGVSVGVMGVSVGGTGEAVNVGMCVLVAVGKDVFVGNGGRVLVDVGSGSRVRRGTVGVMVTKCLGVFDGTGVSDAVCVGTIVGVGTNSVTDCWVSAAAVLKLLTARSTIFSGSIVTEVRRFKSLMAIAETLHNRLKPITPAARTPSGAV